MTDWQRVHEVPQCSECPFRSAHDDGIGYGYCEASASGEQPIRAFDTSPPDWCPLRKGPILVTLKKECA